MLLKITKFVLQYFLGVSLAFILGEGVFNAYDSLCRLLPDSLFSTLAKYLGSEFYPDVYITVFLIWPLGLSWGMFLIDTFYCKEPKTRIRRMIAAFFASLLGIIIFFFVGLPFDIVIFGMNREVAATLFIGSLFCLIGYNIADWLWKIPKNKGTQTIGG